MMRLIMISAPARTCAVLRFPRLRIWFRRRYMYRSPELSRSTVDVSPRLTLSSELLFSGFFTDFRHFSDRGEIGRTVGEQVKNRTSWQPWKGPFRQLSSFSSFYWIDCLFNKSWKKKKVVWIFLASENVSQNTERWKKWWRIWTVSVQTIANGFVGSYIRRHFS